MEESATETTALQRLKGSTYTMTMADIETVKNEIHKAVLGQDELIDCMLISLLSEGHLLIEGMPGLAKTLAVNSMAKVTDLEMSRVQFTPDLLPADIIGTTIYNPKSHEFSTKKGPLFSNIILADEINRAPAKVQSALLEAMAERQVTIGDHSHDLPKPFMVLATQNPIDHDGTYPLPAAQVDRFMMKCKVHYPNENTEKQIIKLHNSEKKTALSAVLNAEILSQWKKEIAGVHVEEALFDYIVAIVSASRNREHHLEHGASPRASIALLKAAKANAWMNKQSFISPDNIKAMAKPVLRHRLALNYEAESDGLSPEQIIEEILTETTLP